MNTKKFFQASAMLALIGAMVSCNDDFMDRTPVSDLNDANFWRSENDLKIYNNGIYNAIVDANFFCGNGTGTSGPRDQSFIVFDIATDNMASADARQGNVRSLGAGKMTVDNTYYSFYIGWSWGLLYRINYFLDNYEKAVDVSPEVQRRYAGEALLFRAWFYFDKVQQYGDVPLVTHVLTEKSPELYAARNPRTQVMEQVLADIDQAIAWLPESWGTSAYNSRFNKYQALALKTRICLYEGTWRKYHTEFNLPEANRFLQQAVDAASALMESGRYSVYNTGNPATDYRKLFTSTALQNLRNTDGTTEVIIGKYYELGKYGTAILANFVNTSDCVVGPTKDFVEDFLVKESDTEALPISQSQVYDDSDFESQFENRDPRLWQTVLRPKDTLLYLGSGVASIFNFPHLPGVKNQRGVVDGRLFTNTGYNYIKNLNIIGEPSATSGNEVTDFPIIRYAEILLAYAEAKAELNNGTLSQDELDKSINVLRGRVAMPHLTPNPQMDTKYANDGISALLVEIRRERRVELSFENSRWHDLMRWKKVDYLNKKVLGIRLEDAWLQTGGRYAGTGSNRPTTVEVNGKKYIDVYAGTVWAEDNRNFSDKNYLYPNKQKNVPL
jgi:hypothetical protein